MRRTSWQALRAALLLSIPLLASARAATGVTFSDGEVHVIDASNSFTLEGAQILDGPGPTATEVIVVDGGTLGSLNADDVEVFGISSISVLGGEVGGVVRGFETASVSVSGGFLDGIEAHGDSSLAIDGGVVESFLVELLDDAVGSISGGDLQAGVAARDRSSLVVSGGSMPDLTVTGSAEVTIEGVDDLDDVFVLQTAQLDVEADGSRRLFVEDEATARISGGSFNLVSVQGAGIVEGTTGNPGVFMLEASEGGQILVSTLRFGQLFAMDVSSVEIRGLEFDRPSGPVTATEGSLNLVLESGEHINPLFQRDPTAIITLVRTGPVRDVPAVYHEPSGTFFLRRAPYSFLSVPYDTRTSIAPGSGWVPVAGDWDGDGEDGVGIFSAESGSWFLIDQVIDSPDAPQPADHNAFITTDGSDWIPITGDWDGDGQDGIGVYHKISGSMFLVDDPTQGASAPSVADYNVFMVVDGSHWLPIAGDWDGDGQDGVGIYSTRTGTMFLANDVTLGGSAATFLPGEVAVFQTTNGAGHLPLAGSWTALSHDGIGIWEIASGAFYLVDDPTPGANPADDTVILIQGGNTPNPPLPGGPLDGPDFRPLAGAWGFH